MRRLVKNGFYLLQRQAARARMGLGAGESTSALPIFTLHAIARAFSEMAVSAQSLRVQLLALRAAGCQALRFSEALAALARPLEHPSFSLTFDDGYDSVHDPGLALLEELSVPATLFVTVNFIEKKVAPPWHSRNRYLVEEYTRDAAHFQPLDWGRLKELAASGRFEIGSHSLNHHLMGTLGSEQLRQEVRESKQILEDRLGVPVRYFSYPFGVRRYGAYTPATEEALHEAGYAASCTSEIGRAQVGHAPFLLPRLALVDKDTGLDARAKAAGAYDWVGVAQRAFQSVFPNPHQANA